MPEHVHGCLNCRPDMVPDFDKDDHRYHGGDACKVDGLAHGSAMVDGAPVSYTQGVFEGAEGWALFVGATTEDVHPCPTCTTYTTHDGHPLIAHFVACVDPRFGSVTITCPARGEV